MPLGYLKIASVVHKSISIFWSIWRTFHEVWAIFCIQAGTCIVKKKRAVQTINHPPVLELAEENSSVLLFLGHLHRWKCSMNLVLFICLFVSPLAVPDLGIGFFFWFFCMKLHTLKVRKIMRPNFWEEILLAQEDPKMGLLVFWQKSNLFICKSLVLVLQPKNL